MLLDRHPGALTADLRRHYGLSLREAVTELPLRELIDLIDQLPPNDSAFARAELGGLADWRLSDENVAMLVDTQRSWLQFLWTQWTASESERRRRNPGRSPKSPPVLPYALRPPEVTAALERAAERAGGASSKQRSPGDRSGMRQMSIEELAVLV